jgi:hypothetical protein
MATFDEIQNAFSFVSSDEYGMNRALLCLDNGEIYYHSENGDFDELDEDKFDCDHFIEIPHKNDLDLGERLVFDFAEQHLADELDRVQQIFSYRGAYRRFKDFQEHRDSCRTGTISRTKERKRRFVSGPWITRSN